MSATRCCTSGWYAIERVSATDDRCGAFSTVMSNARWAMPWYTDAKPRSAQAKTATWNMPAPAKPAGHTSATCDRARRRRGTRCPGSAWHACRRCPTCRRPRGLRIRGDEAVDDLRRLRVAGGHRVEPAEGPHRGERAEDLVAVDLPATVDPLGRARRQQQREVVAGLAVQRGQDLARGGRVEQEIARVIAGLAQVGGHAGPVHVHVHPEGGGGGVVGEPAVQLDVLVEAEPAAAHVGRARRRAGSPSRAAPRSLR